MRDDLVMAEAAEGLRNAGLAWHPQPGDWCALLGAAHIAGNEAGIWLVIETTPTGGLTVVDGAARWAARRIVAAEALWLPTVGQLKGWLRANGYAVSTIEGGDVPPQPRTLPNAQRPAWAASVLSEAAPSPPRQQPTPPTRRHQCRALRAGAPPIEAWGGSEAEAVAGVVVLALPAPHH